MTRLVLWDVDGTLVDFAGLGASIYADAFRALTGEELRHEPITTGRTEWAITDALLAAHGIPPTDNLRRSFFDAIDRATEQAAPELAAHGRILPGVAEVLVHLAHSPGVLQSLATGNTPTVARIKLDALGLARHLALDIGGYGTDSPHRPGLVKLAIDRAIARLGAAPDQPIVIGDTPWDIEAARAHGAIAVGVATGAYPEQDLLGAGASAAVRSLREAARRQRLYGVLDLARPRASEPRWA